MSDAIIVALITGAITLFGTIITVIQTSRKTEEAYKIHQAVTDAKIEHLTEEVRKHNNFAERLPKLEQRVDDLEKHIDK